MDITNSSTETVLLDLQKHLGIVDIRSIRYYQVKHDTLQQEPSNHYQFENLEKLCDSYNKMILQQQSDSKVLNKHGDSKHEDLYPWLEPDDVRRNLSGEEILERYINLDDSCLNEHGKKKLLRHAVPIQRSFFSER